MKESVENSMLLNPSCITHCLPADSPQTAVSAANLFRSANSSCRFSQYND
jgi:hypothetical protein